MRKFLEYKILVAILAVSVSGTGNIVFAANTGITSSTEAIGNSSFYVGSNGPSDNKVSIDTSIDYGIAGGYDKDGSNGATDNFVNINGTESVKTVVNGYVYGSYSENGIVNSNNIEISNSDITRTVYGGCSQKGEVSNNEIIVSNSSVGTSVYGGFTNNGNIEGNDVTINGSSLTNVYGGQSTSGNVSNNHVMIIGNTVVNGTVDGGYSPFGSISKNEVNIYGGTLEDRVSGGFGGNSKDSVVSGNIVNISGGTINGKVYGGYGYQNNPYDNKVNISGGTVNGAIYGGLGYTGANNNSINISGSADIANADLYGANKIGGTGNTLTIDNWSGSTKSVQNFNTINFANIEWQNGAEVLRITNNTKSGVLANTEINIQNLVFQGGVQLGVGDSMSFISGDDLQIDQDKVSADGNFTAGVTI